MISQQELRRISSLGQKIQRQKPKKVSQPVLTQEQVQSTEEKLSSQSNSYETQELINSALQTGYYGSINIKAKEGNLAGIEAKRILDKFFNTPEGRRFASNQATIKQMGYSNISAYTQDLARRGVFGLSPPTIKVQNDLANDVIVTQTQKNTNIFTESSKPFDLKKQIESYKPLTIEQLRQVPMSAGGLAPELTSAPTTSEKYKQAVQQSGYVKGTLNFVGDIAEQKVAEHQQKTGDYYQAKGFRNIARNSPNLVYFTPYVGAGTLIAGGLEDVGTSSGRERLKQQSLYFQTEKGYSPTTSNVLSYGIPVAEIGLGTIGIKGEVGNIKATREVNLWENAPVKVKGVRIQGEKGGFDVLFGYQKTSPSWAERNILRIKPQEALTEIKQPFFFAGEDRITMEGGKGLTFIKQVGGKKAGFSLFNIGGVSEVTGSEIMISTSSGRVGTGFQGATGRISLRELFSSEGIIQKRVNFLTSDITYTYKGKIIKSDKELRKIFMAGSMEEKNIIKVLGANPEKAILDLKTGRTGIKGKLSSTGAIKKINVPSAEDVFFSTGGGNILTGGTTASYSETAVREATKLASSPKSESILRSSETGGVFPAISTQKKISSQEQQPVTKQVQKDKPQQAEYVKQEVKQSEKNILNIKQIPILKVREKEKTKIATAQQNVLGFSEVQKEKTKTSQVPRQEFQLLQREQQKQPQASATRQKILQRQKQSSMVGTTGFDMFDALKKVKKIIKKNPEKIGVFGRRFGKDIKLGAFSTKKEAEKELDKFLRGSLGRSGFLKTESGKKVESDLLKMGFYRPSKKDKFRIVQLAKYSLSGAREKSEIQYFKRKAGKRKNKKSGWLSWI